MSPFNWQTEPSALPPAREKKLSRPSLGPLKNGLYALSKRPGDMPIEPKDEAAEIMRQISEQKKMLALQFARQTVLHPQLKAVA